MAGVAVRVNAAGWPLVTVRDAEALPLTVSVKDGDGCVLPLPVPMPVRMTLSGNCVALLESDRMLGCAALAVGVKVMLRVHWAPAASVAPEAGQVLLLTV